MPIAILDPFSGIAGDMMLGALLDVGLDAEWLVALPGLLALDGVSVRITDVRRAGIACKKVDFDIPAQPHGRHLKDIRAIVARAPLPPQVRERADRVYEGIAVVEAAIHGTTPERVHFHEVGAVDAILDVVGAVWGVERLGIERIHCGPIAMGDGAVETAHGLLPVPAPATLKLLEGLAVRPGPDGAGELVTPTGAALVRVLSSGPPPASYVPLRSGYGAGTKDPTGRPNALRVILAEPAAQGNGTGSEVLEDLVLVAADIDDMPGEQVAEVAELLRRAGALDVVLVPTLMKKGRPGTRVEMLVRPAGLAQLESLLLQQSSTIGVRRTRVERRALAREMRAVEVLGHEVAVKIVELPGGGRRAKPEFEDVRRVAQATGRPIGEVFTLTARAVEHL